MCGGIPGPTFIILEIESVFLVRDNLLHVYDALVVELSQNLNLSDGCDWEALLFIVQPNFLQSHHFSYYKENKQGVRTTSLV